MFAIVTVRPCIDLTAAATGANKITLYWTGIPTASGYDIYRSAASGGPYSLIAANVDSLDPGPGLTNTYMYTDTGLTTGTEYYYVVYAIVSGLEATESNEDMATPDPSAIPWDTANAATIVSLLSTDVEMDAAPNVDEDTDDEYPTEAGLLTAVGPDGVMYQGNYLDGSAPAAFGPSTSYDEYSGIMTFSDGTAASMPGDDTYGADPLAAPILNTGESRLFSMVSAADDTSFGGNGTGIWREVISQPGAGGFAGTAQLPNTSNGQQIQAFVRPYPRKGLYSDACCIYTGGNDADGHFLDVGLMAQADMGGNYTPGWIPFVSGGALHRASWGRGTDTVRGQVNNGNLAGHKIAVTNETRMQFMTPALSDVPAGTVMLNLGVPINGLLGGAINVYVIDDTGTLSPAPPTQYNYATFVYYVGGWTKQGNKMFQVKRINSIAQTLQYKNNFGVLVHRGYPQPRTNEMFLEDYTSLYSAGWGWAADPKGVMINMDDRWQTWTDDSSLTYRAGAYPFGYYHCVTWFDQNAYFWENHLSLHTADF